MKRKKRLLDTERKNGEAPPEQLFCRDCGAPLELGQYRRVRDGVIHEKQPVCRSQQLTTEIAKELGVKGETWLFSKRPREDIFAEMDLRPPNWKKGDVWLSSRPAPYRIRAAIDYHSWCYPVCISYAVQIDADDVPLKDRNGKWVRHTRETLAKFLGMSISNFNRDFQWLVKRGMARLDEETGALSLVPNPPILTAEERLALNDEGSSRLRNMSPVNLSIRDAWADLLVDCPDSLGTESKTIMTSLCTGYNQKLQLLRTEVNDGAKAEVKRLATLLSRDVDLISGRAKSSGATKTRPPAPGSPVEGPGSTTPKYLPADDLTVSRQPGDTVAQLLYRELQRLQSEYPRSTWGTRPISPENAADRKLMDDFVTGLARIRVPAFSPVDVAAGFIAWIEGQFMGEPNALAKRRSRPKTRSPYDEGGPDSMALLVLWVGDYGREAKVYLPALRDRAKKLEEQAKHAEELQAGWTANREREQAADEARWQHLVEHPEDCERCHGAGRFPNPLAADRPPVLCGCPAGVLLENNKSEGAI